VHNWKNEFIALMIETIHINKSINIVAYNVIMRSHGRGTSYDNNCCIHINI